MSSSRATPTVAQWYSSPDRIVVAFDEQLVDLAPSEHSTWTVRYNNFIYTATAAGISGAAITVSLTQAGADAGADVISYTPPPADVVTRLSDLPVLAFADFPVTT